MHISQKTGRAYVGTGCPIRESPDGTIRLGTRKFTAAELVQYKKNMYGESYFSRHWKKIFREKTPNEMKEICVRRVQTIYDRYGDDYFAKMGSRSFNSEGGLIDWLRSDAGREFNRQRMSANRAKLLAGRAKNDFLTKSPRHRYYFICDWQEGDRKFKKLDWIYIDDPIFERMYEMKIVCQRKLLETRDQKRVARLTSYFNGVKFRFRDSLSRRPDVVISLLSEIN